MVPDQAGLRPDELDAVAHSYDPSLAPPAGADRLALFYRTDIYVGLSIPG